MTTLQSGVINWQKQGYNSYSVGYLACSLAPVLSNDSEGACILPSLLPSLPRILRTCSASWGDGRHGNLPRSSVQGCESGRGDVMLLAAPAHEGCSNLERGGGHRQCVLCVCRVRGSTRVMQTTASLQYLLYLLLQKWKFCQHFSAFAHPHVAPNSPCCYFICVHRKRRIFERNLPHTKLLDVFKKKNWNVTHVAFMVFCSFRSVNACACIKKI